MVESAKEKKNVEMKTAEDINKVLFNYRFLLLFLSNGCSFGPFDVN